MTATSFRAAAAVAAAGVAAMGAALTVAVAPTAHAVLTMGAVAIGPDGHWGISYGKENISQAANVASGACGDGCKVQAFTGCAAIARDGNSLYSAFANTKADAERSVQAQHPGSTLVTWACNNPPGSGPTSWRG